jgi:hypothetical protein
MTSIWIGKENIRKKNEATDVDLLLLLLLHRAFWYT